MNVARKQPVLQGMRECFSRSVLSCQFAESLHEFSSKYAGNPGIALSGGVFR